MDNRLPALGGGVVIGALLALGGGYAARDHFIPAPVVNTVTVEKIVEKKVKVPVVTERETFKNKLYRASLLDANGNVTESWEVKKLKLIVVGASLTDLSGNTFVVNGRIKIEPINEGSR